MHPKVSIGKLSTRSAALPVRTNALASLNQAVHTHTQTHYALWMQHTHTHTQTHTHTYTHTHPKESIGKLSTRSAALPVRANALASLNQAVHPYTHTHTHPKESIGKHSTHLAALPVRANALPPSRSAPGAVSAELSGSSNAWSLRVASSVLPNQGRLCKCEQ